MLFTSNALAQLFSGGAGTFNDPYLISNYNDLVTLSANAEYWKTGTFYKQTADIDLPNALDRQEEPTAGGGKSFPYNLSPIGNNSTFSAVYWGEGHSISGLTIQAPWVLTQNGRMLPDNQYTTLPLTSFGLFTNTFGATIDGVVLKKIAIYLEVSDANNKCIGGLIGLDQGNTTVTNCSVEGTIDGYDCVGGMIGNSNPLKSGDGTLAKGIRMEGCAAYINTISGINNVGGIAGKLTNASLKYSLVQANKGIYSSISGERNTGGFIGQANQCTIENCYSRNELDLNDLVANHEHVGSFIGFDIEGTYTNCYASTSENGLDDEYHHFIGYQSDENNSAVTNCFENSDQTSLIDGIVSLPNDKMKSPNQFIYKGWDFKDIWRVGKKGYPTLSVHLASCLPDGETLPFLWVGKEGSANTWQTEKAWFGESVPHVDSRYGSDVYIPASTTCTINSADAECYNLVVAEDAKLIIEYSISKTDPTKRIAGQLYVANNSLGQVEYKAYINHDTAEGSTGWHYISSPVKGQSINAFLKNPENGITINKYYQYALGILRQGDEEKGAPAIVDFPSIKEEVPTDLSYYDYLHFLDDDVVFTPGISHTLHKAYRGYISFTGEVNTDPVTVISKAKIDEPKWAFLGNPYTAALDGEYLYNRISTKLDKLCRAIYIYDAENNQYIAQNLATGVEPIAPCQGFHIYAMEGGNSITMSQDWLIDPSERNEAILKSSTKEKISFDIELSTSNTKATCSVYFSENQTNGLDPSWDAMIPGTTKDSKPSIATKLVDATGYEDCSFLIQTLGTDNVCECSIPLSIQTGEAEKLYLTITKNNLPKETAIYLYDKELEIETEVKPNTPYAFSPGTMEMKERFRINLKSTTGIETAIAEQTISVIPQASRNNLQIEGVTAKNATITMYTCAGNVVLTKRLSNEPTQNIAINAQLTKGIYLVKIQEKNHMYSQKIRW